MLVWKQKGDGNQLIIETLLTWGKANYREYPWRTTSNHFHALVAEIMLQRTKADQVLGVYNNFTRKYVTSKDVCSDSPENVAAILKPLGLTWRTKKIGALSCEVTNSGSVPDSFEELAKLPGIGQYAASAFLSLHSNQRYPLIDANTIRVWGRVYGFMTDAETRRKKWFRELVEKLTPEIAFRDFNYAILDFSSLICKPKPLCSVCPINRMCCYFQKKLQ